MYGGSIVKISELTLQRYRFDHGQTQQFLDDPIVGNALQERISGNIVSALSR
jgi:hypothetical protein